MSQVLLEDLAPGIRRVRIDRPDVRNALAPSTALELARALREAGGGETRVVLLTGSGEAFSAGGDLKALVDLLEGKDAAQVGDTIYEAFQGVIRAVRGVPVPVVGAVNGVAVGGGADLAVACDFRIASEKARFSWSWAKLGLAPGMGGSFLLSRSVGPGAAARLIYTADLIDATEALRLGIVSKVVAPERLESEALEWAGRIAALPREALVESKASILRTVDAGLDEELRKLSKIQGRLLKSETFREAAHRFLGGKGGKKP